jgi:cell division septum initiation protein DivIVA
VIRSANFSQRRRGFDEAESECADLRAETDRLRAEVDRWRTELVQREENPPEINERAVALFSQAQQVADKLVEEAVQHARDLMSAARAQEREIVQRAHETAAREAGGRSPGGAADRRAGHGGGGSGPDASDIEYVRTFARVAQVQFRSVLEALSEQVDRLGQLPDASEVRRSGMYSGGYSDESPELSPDVSWHREPVGDELDGHHDHGYPTEPPDPARR